MGSEFGHGSPKRCHPASRRLPGTHVRQGGVMTSEHNHYSGHYHGPGGCDTTGRHGMLLFGANPVYLSHLMMYACPHNLQVPLEVGLDSPALDTLRADHARQPARRAAQNLTLATIAGQRCQVPSATQIPSHTRFCRTTTQEEIDGRRTSITTHHHRPLGRRKGMARNRKMGEEMTTPASSTDTRPTPGVLAFPAARKCCGHNVSDAR
jgi:hypothetical protein